MASITKVLDSDGEVLLVRDDPADKGPVSDTPLLRMLREIPERDRLALGPFWIHPGLGYKHHQQFRTLEETFRWLGGYRYREGVEGSIPADEEADPLFDHPVSWEDVKESLDCEVSPQREAQIQGVFGAF